MNLGDTARVRFTGNRTRRFFGRTGVVMGKRTDCPMYLLFFADGNRYSDHAWFTEYCLTEVKMEKLQIFCADGLSASSTDGDNLSEIIQANLPKDARFKILSQGVDFEGDFDRYVLGLTTSREWSVLLCGKSAGAFKMLDKIQRDYNRLAHFRRLAVLTVDPHYPAKADRKKPINMLVYSPLMKMYNVRQAKHYPTGAPVFGADNILLSGVDHFSILKSPEIIKCYNKLIDYLGEE